MRKVLADIEADTSGTDYGYVLTHRLAVAQYVKIPQHLRVIHAFDFRYTGRHAGGKHNLIEAAVYKLLYIDAGIQAQLHAPQLNLAPEVAQGFVELFLARHLLGHIELTADFL